MNLDLTLKAAAILLLLISGLEYVLSSVIHLGPVLFANVMFVTSIFSRTQPQRIAVIALAFAVVIPIGAFRAYFRDDSALWVALLNLGIFCYVAFVAVRTLMAHSGRHTGNGQDP